MTDPRSPIAIPALLLSRLGPLRALRVVIACGRRLARGEPFAHLPPAADDRERDSRAQAAPVIVLFRALEALAVPDALGLVGEVVELGAIRFLGKSIGPIRRDALAAMDDAARRRWVDERARRFPNAVPNFEAVGPDEVRFRIHDCRFVSLAAAAGQPALAAVFCRGDARYFGQVERGVVLERPHTLAGGGPDCPFTLRFADPE